MLFDASNRAKPVLKWAGGKSGPLEHLVKHFPSKAEKYFEPFFGGGAVFFALDPRLSSHINDANPELIHLYKTIKKSPVELMKALDGFAKQYDEDFYYEMRAKEPSDGIEKAARTVFLNKTGYNGLYRVNSNGKFNVPFGKRPRCPKLYTRENVFQVSERLKKARITNWDFEKVINLAEEGSILYCDPPYEPLNPTSSFNQYLSGGFSQVEQTRLKVACERAVERGAQIILSNSKSPFIKALYCDWKIKFIPARRAINSKGAKRGYISESLILMGN
mgnify:CR=1 FL=1